MNLPDDVRMPDVPQALPVVSAADLPRVRAWADRQRQQLVELRSILRDLESDPGPAGSPAGDPVDPKDRAAIEAAVDSVLEDAMVRLDSELERARDRATHLVADAIGAAMVELASAEIDPASILRIDLTSLTERTSLRRPRHAAEFSRAVQDNRNGRTPVEVESVVLDPSCPPPGPGDEGGAPSDFSDFWVEVPSDQSVLERIRRRRPKAEMDMNGEERENEMTDSEIPGVSWQLAYDRPAVDRFLAEAEAERVRLTEAIAEARSRADAARTRSGTLDEDAQAELGALVLAAQAELAAIEREHRELIDSIRATAQAEADWILASARAEAEAIRRSGATAEAGPSPSPGVEEARPAPEVSDGR